MHLSVVMKYVAIIGSGNMGTKTLGTNIGKYSGTPIISKWEPEPKLLVEGVQYPLDYNDVFNKFFNTRIEWTRCCNIFVESNSCLWSSIPIIKRVFHDAKIVHIVRDGTDYLRSVLTIYDKTNNVRVASLPQYKSLMEEFGNTEWSNLQFYSWYWHYVNYVIERDAENEVLQYIKLGFKELFKGKGSARIDLENFLGFRFSSFVYGHKENYRPQYEKLPPFEEWSEDDQQIWYKEKEKW